MGSGPRKRLSNTSDDFIKGDEPPRGKKPKIDFAKSSINPANLGRKTDGNGDKYWEISKMRRITVSSFRGKTMVNIREYYEKDGQELPGKKGISLPIDQFNTLMTLLPDIEAVLKESGAPTTRPDYIAASANLEGNNGNDGSDGGMHGVCASRKNIEATSDEDESDG